MTKPSVGDVGPQLRRRYERMMIERLTELLRKEISEQAVTEAEVAEHVEKHRSTLEPEVLVRVSQIMLGSKKEAEELLTEISGASDRVGWLTRVLSSMWRIDHSSCARRAASCGQRRKRDRAQSVLVSVELDTRSRRELPDVPDGELAGPARTRGSHLASRDLNPQVSEQRPRRSGPLARPAFFGIQDGE